MEEHATGLILRTRPLTESSVIVHWLTRESGRLSTAARGARRPKSAFRGKLDLFFLAEFSFTRSRRSDLHALKEVRLSQTFENLRRDYEKLQQAAYAAAFIERTTETDTPIEDVFGLMLEFIAHVNAHAWRQESVLWFELRLLALLGVQPEESRTAMSPRTRRLMESLYSGASINLDGFQPDAGEVKELIRFLHGFIIYHFDRLPPGRGAALRYEE